MFFFLSEFFDTITAKIFLYYKISVLENIVYSKMYIVVLCYEISLLANYICYFQSILKL
jgi:hypothetical protein